MIKIYDQIWLEQLYHLRPATTSPIGPNKSLIRNLLILFLNTYPPVRSGGKISKQITLMNLGNSARPRIYSLTLAFVTFDLLMRWIGHFQGE